MANNNFSWYELIRTFRNTPQDVETLRGEIDKHGINSRDNMNRTIFDVLGHSIYTFGKFLIDVIFEFKPLLSTYLKNRENVDSWYFRPYCTYILLKFLEQDAKFINLRYDFRHDRLSFRVFIVHCYHSKCHFDATNFVYLFKNFFFKEITFFELMKHRLFE